MTIPRPKAVPKNKYFPHGTGLVVDEVDKEVRPFHISYEYYNDGECQVVALIKNRAKRALEVLRIVGRMLSVKEFHGEGVGTVSVKNMGDYARLYSGLAEDIELKEHRLQGVSRIFYFTVGRVFYPVAIRNSHYEVGKRRR